MMLTLMRLKRSCHRSREQRALQFKVQRFCEERNAPTFNWTRLMSNDRLRDLMNWDARHKRDLPKGKESSEPHHVLAEDNLDDGDGASGKSRHGYRRGKKWQRRRLGGITATVSGCRLLLDLNEQQFGEGISQVYVALAGVAAFIQDGMAVSTWGYMSSVMHMGSACALEPRHEENRTLSASDG